ncbi:hypothetical protein BKN49_05545 [Pseudomonas aeruginosa]|nr:hypothetical protein BKN49_05545 [Pseudomonas aeruginosa]
MRIKDQVFTVGKGQQMSQGKSHYPDLLRLVVPKHEAIAFAQKILRAYELAKDEDTHLMEIPLFGELESLEDE